MRTRSLRHVGAITALALISLAAAAACGSAPVRPMPGESPATTPSASTPGTVAPGAPTPSTSDPTHSATSPPRCLGAVVYKLDAALSSKPPWSSPCITVGGVIWISQVGPGDLTVEPWNKVACDYEAAENPCRLIGTGTVKFTTSSSAGVRSLTVKVVAATTPPRPSPACDEVGTYPAGEPLYWSRCLKVNSVLHFPDNRPDDIFASPSDAVSCIHEGDAFVCRLLRATTVIFTIGPAETTFIVVAIN
jgi:hypothetical protein